MSDQQSPGVPPTRRRMSGYAAVTILAAVANQACYVALLAAGLWAPAAALLAATVLAWPTFTMLRRLVWAVPHGGIAQFGAYWLMSAANVAVATLSTAALQWAGAPTGVLAVAPLAVYTTSWVVRYLLLDRVLFRRRSSVARSA